jgi:hypothetical protein
MVPEPKVSAEHREAILAVFPSANLKEADAAIAEIEEILGEFQAHSERAPKMKQAIPQLDALAEAASQMHLAIGGLSTEARTFFLMDPQRVGNELDLQELSRSSLWLSSWARRAADEIRPGEGRPVAWPGRMAVAALAEFWERRTGKSAYWTNAEEEGGEFARFVYAVSERIGERSIRAVLRDRGRNSAD